ncbi:MULTISPECIES: calcium/sodium antiporter [Hyphobacterium]|uniref:Calcium/sodium antiporter n=1 Tax=Hyphobacterium vulgare TaxID=1736751 RepID=A0ABV6ZZR2_9PROT
MSEFLLIAGGLVLLAIGGDVLVRGAVGTASKLGVSPLLIGLVLVGFGTSMPELTTSVQAALSGSPGIAVGNVVGSNIANILLILGAAAVIAPIAVAPGVLKRDGSFLALSQIALAVALFLTPVGRTAGGMLFAGLIAYIGLSYWLDRRSRNGAAALHTAEAESVAPPKGGLPVALLLLAGGIAGVVIGAKLLVDGAISIAEGFGISDAVIGLTVVAVGTSLPELAASVAAAMKRQGDIALGNVIGSNIFNALGILGATAIIRPIEVPPSIIASDMWIMLGAAALLVLVAATGRRVGRMEGVVLLALYAAYTAWLAMGAV